MKIFSDHRENTMLRPLNLLGSAIIASITFIPFYSSSKDFAESAVGVIFIFALSLFALDFLRNYLRSNRRKRELLYKNY